MKGVKTCIRRWHEGPSLPSELRLEKGEIARIHDVAGGLGIQCRCGLVWITQEGDRRDYLLREGDVWYAAGHGLALVETFEAAVVCITGAASRPVNRYIKFSGFNAWSAFGTKRPFSRISFPSKRMVPPP